MAQRALLDKIEHLPVAGEFAADVLFWVERSALILAGAVAVEHDQAAGPINPS